MLTVMSLLIVAAFICTIVSALGKCPEWVALVLICVILMLQILPKN
jgi:hypothetical protein